MILFDLFIRRIYAALTANRWQHGLHPRIGSASCLLPPDGGLPLTLIPSDKASGRLCAGIYPRIWLPFIGGWSVWTAPTLRHEGVGFGRQFSTSRSCPCPRGINLDEAFILYGRGLERAGSEWWWACKATLSRLSFTSHIEALGFGDHCFAARSFLWYNWASF